jgi:hypothetical protein
VVVLLQSSCAVHRQEGQCIGEFGSGFSNANYWWVGLNDADALATGMAHSQQVSGRGGCLLTQHWQCKLLCRKTGSGVTLLTHMVVAFAEILCGHSRLWCVAAAFDA